MLRRYRFALHPGWVAFHLFTAAAAVTMVFLGRWQLHVSESKHFNIQNFGYSIQWWLFAGFALFFWSRLLRDNARRLAQAAAPGADPAATSASASASASAEGVAADPPPVAYRRYVMPTASQSGDPMHAAYNDYLAELAAKDAEER